MREDLKVSICDKTISKEINLRSDSKEAYLQRTQKYKSSLLGREYPVTAEGAEQMRKDEAAYWERQKKDI